MTSGDELRALMRDVPASVAVVTVDAGRQSLGLTVTSLVSLSLEPPLVGIAIARQAALHELVREAGAFAVSILAAGQERIAQHFARGVPPIALWSGIETRQSDLGPPLIEGALGWIECLLVEQHATGDHTFFVGEVVATQQGTSRAALIYVGQAYE